MPECSVSGCLRDARSKGLCISHYMRKRRYGSTDGQPPKRATRFPGRCSVPECARKAWCKGLCPLHYGRKWRHGDTDDLRSKPSAVELGHKICITCKRDLPISEFYPRTNSKHVSSQCKACALASRILSRLNETKEQKLARLEKQRPKTRARWAEMRLQVIAGYGGRCCCPGCNESHPEFLTIDHVNNDGASRRRENLHRESGRTLMRRIIRMNYPPEYQILCQNCNTAKGIYGVCPHSKEQRIQAPLLEGSAPVLPYGNIRA